MSFTFYFNIDITDITVPYQVPSPPPNAGVHTFPVTDFPPPREFKGTPKVYISGSQHGNNFDLDNL